MRIGWLADEHDPPGGAELTQAEFRAAAPEEVQVVEVAPGDPKPDLRTYVAHNCQTYGGFHPGGRLVRYLHDMRGGMIEGADLIFCSPLQRDAYGLDGHLIPPPVDLTAFRPTRQQRRNTKRAGACCVGAFMNPGKAGYRVAVWADENEPVDVYGYGPYLPDGPNINHCGPVDRAQLPTVLAKYERFVFLPTSLEPFGRCVAEAWAAGCEIVTNNLVGARYWIEEKPEALETAAEDFWGVVLDA